MLAIERADVRRFRAVARRGCPNGRPKGPAPPVLITGSGGVVTLACHLGEVVVALRCIAPQSGTGSITLSLTDLDAIEGGSAVVTLDPAGDNAVTAKWDTGPAPRTARLATFESQRDWPAEAENLMAISPGFPKALHEVGRSAARDPGRYAVTRVQVRGQAGELAGTDGKHALVWGGFKFAFPDDLLVPAVPLFGSKELAGESAVSVGLAGEWLYIVIGPWQVWLWVDREGRFPDVHGAAPRSCPTRVAFDDRDVDGLLRAMPRLPAMEADGRPVTLDLGATVAARSRNDRTEDTAEVRLAHSSVTGPATRVVVGRDHLGRALALGFRELRVSTAERPVSFRDSDRLFLAATLDPSLIVPKPGESAAAGLTNVPASSPPIPTHPDRRIPVPTRDTPTPERNGHAVPADETFDPVAEAEALRADLADAAARAHRLVTLLKQFRKERRALASAWSSLKQLNLGP
jgi:hypothetical protein